MFAMLWAAFLSAHAFANLYYHGWQDTSAIARFALLIFGGTFVGGFLGWMTAVFIGAHRIPPKKFATSLVVILILTIGVTAALFALQYRSYYAQWHAASFSVAWFFQLAFTSASAFYLFAVQGLRTLLPLGPVALLIAGWVFMKYAPSTDE